MIWSRFPAKLEWKKQQLFDPPPDYKGRAKKLGKCHYCGFDFPGSALEVDHVAQAGQCSSWETSSTFLRKLLATDDNWVLACKGCHKIKSYAERHDIDFKKAMVEKTVIALLKKPRAEVVAYCLKHGYKKEQLRNIEQRRAAVTEILSKGLP